jgi:drug/metabolite transporter (DMT)-like permease
MLQSRHKGILYILLAAFCFSLMNLFVRLSGDIPSIQKSFFRNLVAAFFALAILLKSHSSFRWQKGNLKFLLLRAAFGTIGILGNFYAVDHLVLSDASMLNKMSPFFGVLFSYLFLKEKCKPAQVFAVIGAFIGSLFIVKPTFSNMNLLASTLGFMGGMCAGAAYTCVRYLGNHGEKGPYIVFFFSCFSCLVTLPYLLFSYHPMELWQLGSLLLAGLSATGGQFAITAAYSYAPAREISVYDYSQILFSAILGFLVFHQIPDRYSVLGYVIITAMAVYMYLYNRSKSEPPAD